MPFSDFVSKAKNRSYKFLQGKIVAFIDKFRDTRVRFDSGGLLYLLDVKSIKTSNYNERARSIFNDNYLNHKFNLLGSNWVCNRYSENEINNEQNISKVKNFSPIKMLHKSQKRKSFDIYNLISTDYVPIDWQYDFKSDHRWSVKEASTAIKYGKIEGHDVKVPIELGRLQHLLQLALFALSEKKDASKYVRSVKNQLLDFIALNPPRYGVNWIFSMDVGIRVVNMLLAVDICRQICPSEMDYKFTSIFTSSVYDHGLHIINNLEYSKEITSNHYLANIVGLLFVSVYLSSTDEVDSWLAFSIQEIISEFSYQYYGDGVNFEGSSSYHRLSTEMLIYARATILGLSSQKLSALRQYSADNWSAKPKLKKLNKQDYKLTEYGIQFPSWFDEKLASSVKFTNNITKQDGLIWQFGDNDSGRLVKILSLGMILDNGEIWENKCLDHSELFYATNGIFEDIKLPNNSSTVQTVLLNLCKCNKIKRLDTDHAKSNSYDFVKLFNNKEKLIFRKEIIIRDLRLDHKTMPILTEGLIYRLYPSGGVLVYKSKRMFLGLNCVPNGSNGNGGHNHNDQLSIELQIDGIDISADPGTYLYTSNPKERNNFRSIKAHNTLRVDKEPNEFFGNGDALFAKENTSKAKFIEIKKYSAVMQLVFGNIKQQRSIIIKDDCVEILDESNYDFQNKLNTFIRYSPGYGKVANRINNFKHITIEYKT